MIVIFQCYGGTHTSVVAAAIYTGRLPRQRLPDPGELDGLPYFDRVDAGRVGNLHFCGVDAYQNPVFVLGSRKWGGAVQKMLAAWLDLQETAVQDVAVIDCLKHVSLPVRLGGILSRRLRLTFPGRRLVNFGLRKKYGTLLELVELFEKDRSSFIISSAGNEKRLP